MFGYQYERRRGGFQLKVVFADFGQFKDPGHTDMTA